MPDTSDSESEFSDSNESKRRKMSKGGKGSKQSKPKSARREQSYRKAWEKQFPWIKPSKDRRKAVCSTCNVEISAQITTLKLHQKSEKHKKMNIPSSSKTIVDSFVSRSAIQLKKSDEVKRAEIKLVAMMMEHNISFRTADHMADVLKDCFPDSAILKEVKLKRTKCQCVAENVIASTHKENLSEKLKQNKFSILVDESTDIATSQNVVIMVRFPDGNIVGTRFWDLVPIFSKEDTDGAHEGATASRIFSTIMNSFNQFKIPASNIIGFGSDGCNTMMGTNNSVSSRFKEHCPGIYVMKCICHSAHLCASEACKELPQDIEQLAHDVHNVLKHSSKRLIQFSEFQTFSAAPQHRILSPSRTRWLSYEAVVKRMIEQWGPLQLYFTDLQCQPLRSTSAIMITSTYEKLQNPFVRLYYCFLEFALPKFTQLNLLFQSERPVITSLYKEVCDLFKEFLLMYMRRDYVMKNDLSDIDPNNERNFLMLEQIYFGAAVIKRISENPNLYSSKEEMVKFRTNCRAFMITAAKQIKMRFDFGDSILPKLSVLDPVNALSLDREQSLLPLAVKLPRIIEQDDANLQKLDNEWRRLVIEDLPEHIISMTQKTLNVKERNPDKFWVAIKNVLDYDGEPKFKLVSEFALNCLSLPHANADCERCFSNINHVKTKDRNRLKVETVKNIMLAKESVTTSPNSDCTSFVPSISMIRKMTTDNLYPSLPGKAGPQIPDEGDDKDDDISLSISDIMDDE